jgi:ring-1,2-phenylacetyl-CoA epoxidase subunit PaaE
MSKTFQKLRINKLVQETEDSKSIYFDIPENLQNEFEYKAGQYLTIKANINDSEERRAYSLFTFPAEKDFAVTVKKVDDGIMSNFLCNEIAVGDTLEVMPPQGRFGIDLDGDKRRDFIFLTSGSGITPVISIIKAILEGEPLSKVYLYYGNKDPEHTIFKSQLEELSNRFTDQFDVEFIYSQNDKEDAKTKSFSFFKKSEKVKSGRINQKMVKQIFSELKKRTFPKEFLLCGPGDMIDNAEKELTKQGVNTKNIHKELFTNAHLKVNGSVTASSDQDINLEITLNKEDYNLTMDPGKTILEQLLEKKIDAPYSCTSGACSTCMAKLISGKVKMDSCLALDDDEVADGYILTCQSRAESPSIKLTYDI